MTVLKNAKKMTDKEIEGVGKAVQDFIKEYRGEYSGVNPSWGKPSLNATLHKELGLPENVTPRMITDQLEAAGMISVVPHSASSKMQSNYKGRGRAPGYVTIHLPGEGQQAGQGPTGNFNLKI